MYTRATRCHPRPRTEALVEEAGAEGGGLRVGRRQPPRKRALLIPPAPVDVVQYALGQGGREASKGGRIKRNAGGGAVEMGVSRPCPPTQPSTRCGNQQRQEGRAVWETLQEMLQGHEAPY